MTQTTAVMVSGMGPRLLRFKPGTVFTFEGNDQPLSAGVLKDGDLLDASGTTLQDYSLDVDHVVVNPIWNQSGILGWVDATGGIAIFLRAGKEVSAYGPDPTTFVTDGRLQIFGGRGYSGPPNRTLGELQPGSWILCNGYRTRDGVSHALQCYVGNELPPPDAPEPLLQSIREHSQHGG